MLEALNESAVDIDDTKQYEGVSDELVDAVMRDADVTHDAGISKLELKCAIAVWYAEVLPPGMLATRFET